MHRPRPPIRPPGPGSTTGRGRRPGPVRPVALVVLATAVLTALLAAACGTPPRSVARRADLAPGASSTGLPGSAASGTAGTPTPSPARSGSRTASPRASGSARPSGPAVNVKRKTGTDAVALTFDDGPDPVNTPALLDVLKKHQVKATFCLVGSRARDYPAVVARIHAEGHTLCNHTWQHLEDFSGRDDDYVRWDLRNTSEMILKAAPGATLTYYRAPYGNFNARLDGFARELGLQPVGWNVDDECWRTADFGTGPKMSEHMIATVKKEIRPGSIILSHENKKPFTATTYDQFLPWLQEHYRLVTL